MENENRKFYIREIRKEEYMKMLDENKNGKRMIIKMEMKKFMLEKYGKKNIRKCWMKKSPRV